MKKLSYILSLFTAIIVSCTNVEDVIIEDNIVTIYAYHNQPSRVSFNGQASKWDTGDVLNVVVNGLNDIYPFNYTSDNKFVCNSLTLPADQNNLYAFSGVNPDNINISTKTASVVLGATAQVQDNQKPTAHIAGYDILYGAASNVGKDNISIEMNHTIAVLKINITNGLQNTQTIKSVTITTPDAKLTGNYNISPAADNKISKSSDSGSNSVTLTFDNVALSNTDAPFTAWIAVAPFTLANGDEMAIDITTSDDNVYRCVKTFDGEGKTFAAGSIMSTSIALGDNASLVPDNQAENITILVDNSTLPNNFPKNADEKITFGKYTIGGYNFYFNSPTPFFVDASGIKFSAIKDKFNGDKIFSVSDADPAKIKLPVIYGYSLRFVTMKSAGSNETRGYLFSIIDTDGQNVMDENEVKLIDKDKELKLSQTKSGEMYYLKIGNTSVNRDPAVLKKLSLTYTKVE